MKKIILIIAIFSFTNHFSQNDDFFDIGAVAGYNYGSNGDLSINGLSTSIESQEDSGFHAGLFLNFNLPSFYIRPEVVYSQTKSSYESNDFEVSKIDVPIMFGKKILGPLSIFLGPSFQYTLENDLENVGDQKIDIKNDIAINGQFGIGLQLGKQIRLDARYELGISDNISTVNTLNTDNINSEIDAKPSQFIFSLSLQL